MEKKENPVGRICKLNPRDAWSNEALDFTPWLGSEQNFEVLADALNLIDAEVERTEYPIGDFSADIVGRDRDGLILVENQLEMTDHSHLGQILTYLSGLESPAKVVWISTRIREEHRAAMDWLNENTAEEFSFFAVELELIQIGASAPAPLFHVISKPNDWSRHVSARARALRDTVANERQEKYLKFWTQLSAFIDQKDSKFRGSNPPKDHWWQFPTGRSNFSTTLTAGGRDHYVGVELYIHSDQEKYYFDQLYEQREAIESALGMSLEWERLDGKKGSRITTKLRNIDPFDATQTERIHMFYWDNILKFRAVFLPLIRDFD